MSFRRSLLAVPPVLALVVTLASEAAARGGDPDCRRDWRPLISFVEFESLDLEQTPPEPLTVKGKLKLPVEWRGRKCFRPREGLAAVVILHGSAGVDSRGDFYARALNVAGIATLEIDMWEARGIASAADRPPLPIFNYPDAFGALAFLSDHPNVDPERIGVLGFSWGAVITMASATETYASQFGGDLRFRAHVAHYPVCYAYNSGLPGTDFVDLTGFPLMIGIGELDDYDQGSGPCLALRESLPESERDAVEVVPYEGAFHAWDRLQVPIEVMDPFSNLGQGGVVVIAPNVDRAYESRRRVVRFFRYNL